MEQELKVREFVPALLEIKIKEGEIEMIDVEIVHTFLGRFSHAKAKCKFNNKLYTAEGLSRRSVLDKKPNDERAYSIATGRALKGLSYKIKGKAIQRQLIA